MVTEEQITEFETAHGRIAHLKSKNYNKDGSSSWEIVIRKPSRPEYKQFRAQSHNPAQVADAQEVLLRKCCVFPDRAGLDSLLEDYPALPEAASEAFKDLTGMSVAQDVK